MDSQTTYLYIYACYEQCTNTVECVQINDLICIDRHIKCTMHSYIASYVTSNYINIGDTKILA